MIINVDEVKKVLTRLIAIFDLENEILQKDSTLDETVSQQEKEELINYLEWKNKDIICYIKTNFIEKKLQNQTNHNNQTTFLDRQDIDVSSLEEGQDAMIIQDLIKELKMKAQLNMSLIERKKYLIDIFINCAKEAAESDRDNANIYGPKGKATKSITVYGKQTPHIIYNEDI